MIVIRYNKYNKIICSQYVNQDYCHTDSLPYSVEVCQIKKQVW